MAPTAPAVTPAGGGAMRGVHVNTPPPSAWDEVSSKQVSKTGFTATPSTLLDTSRRWATHPTHPEVWLREMMHALTMTVGLPTEDSARRPAGMACGGDPP